MLPDPITAPSPAPALDRDSLKAIMRDVIAEVVQAELLKPLVNAAVAERMEFMRQQISAIDVAQREAYSQFNSTANRVQQSADTFNTTARQLIENVGALKATDNNQAEDIREIKERVDRIEARQTTTDSRLQGIENVQKELHTDIHGNAQDTLRPSIFSMFRTLDHKLDTRFGAIESNIKEIKETQQRHDAFISRQQMIVNLVVAGGYTLLA